MPFLVPPGAIDFKDPPSTKNFRSDIGTKLKSLDPDVRANVIAISRTGSHVALKLLNALVACHVPSTPSATRGE